MMRHAFPTMGTMASLEIPARDADLLPAIERAFDAYERRFSLYRPDSELSRIASGALDLRDASEQMIATYTRAIAWRGRTDGAFTPHRPDGVLDLNGIVKAEAMESAGIILEDAGCSSWTLNVGGDILASSAGWTTGIADPDRDGAILCSIDLGRRRRALATSGSAQRGDHIWLGGELRPAELRQVSVAADSIVTADVLATAIVAAGPDAIDGITARWDIDVLAVHRDGTMVATPGFRSALASAL